MLSDSKRGVSQGASNDSGAQLGHLRRWHLLRGAVSASASSMRRVESKAASAAARRWLASPGGGLRRDVFVNEPLAGSTRLGSTQQKSRYHFSAKESRPTLRPRRGVPETRPPRLGGASTGTGAPSWGAALVRRGSRRPPEQPSSRAAPRRQADGGRRGRARELQGGARARSSRARGGRFPAAGLPRP